jgi:hypothetical protein
VLHPSLILQQIHDVALVLLHVFGEESLLLVLFSNQIFTVLNKIRKESLFLEGYCKIMKNIFIPFEFLDPTLEQFFNENCEIRYELWTKIVLNPILLSSY